MVNQLFSDKRFNNVGSVLSLGLTLMIDSIGKFFGRTITWMRELCGTAKKVDTVVKDGEFFIVGGGIAGLNTALLLLNEGVEGKNITIMDENEECGGIFYRAVSEDGKSFFAHTVRTFDEPSYRYTEKAWREAGIWNEEHLIKRNHSEPRQTVPSEMRDAFIAIASKSDEELENMAISDLFLRFDKDAYL